MLPSAAPGAHTVEPAAEIRVGGPHTGFRRRVSRAVGVLQPGLALSCFGRAEFDLAPFSCAGGLPNAFHSGEVRCLRVGGFVMQVPEAVLLTCT
jgi:hypothetical protein